MGGQAWPICPQIPAATAMVKQLADARISNIFLAPTADPLLANAATPVETPQPLNGWPAMTFRPASAVAATSRGAATAAILSVNSTVARAEDSTKSRRLSRKAVRASSSRRRRVFIAPALAGGHLGTALQIAQDQRHTPFVRQLAQLRVRPRAAIRPMPHIIARQDSRLGGPPLAAATWRIAPWL